MANPSSGTVIIADELPSSPNDDAFAGSSVVVSNNNSIPPIYSPTIMANVESSLQSSLEELHIRHEVDECLKEMLLDIEWTQTLQQELDLQHTKQLLERSQAEHQATILEAKTERLERYNRRIQLADEFVVEIVKLNAKLEQLTRWKEEHSYKVQNYDSLMAKLTQTEEELQAANRVSYGGTPKPRRAEPQQQESMTNNTADTGTTSEDQEIADNITTSTATTTVAANREESIPEKTPEGVGMADIEADVPMTQPLTEGESASDVLKAAMAAEADATATEIEETPTTNGDMVDEKVNLEGETGEEDRKQPAVELIQEEEPPEEKEQGEEKGTTNLVSIDVEILMEVFGYLDPIDILNTAQINVAMYTKIDNIFGISEDGQTPPTPTTVGSTVPSSITSTASSDAAAAAAAASTVSATLAQVPPASTTPAKSASTNTATSTSAASTNAATGPLGKGLFSMLQPAKPASSPPSKATTTSTGTSSTGAATSQPLNAKVAQSMASKLSDVELAAIISMTDKLSKLEKEVHLLRNDKEVLSAKLEGTEAVKQFLIGKVRDVEIKLTRSKEDEVKVTQQIASDQEVIAFLDSRVQELELQTENLTKEMTGTQAELDDLKVSTSKKITMLNDMLKYEREKMREDEAEWKATKKVLVKEVKSCRAQILALQAERDGLKGQNETLQRSMLSMGGINNIGGNSTKSPGRRRKYT